MTPLETIELRTHGFARFLVSGFLAFWLCGWAVGEWFVLRVLWNIFFGNPGEPTGAESFPGSDLTGIGVVVFLLVWLVFWTFGGIAALVTAARTLAGVDLIEVTPGGFTVRKMVGPFERSTWFDRTRVTALYVRRRDRAIVAIVGSKTIAVSSLGRIEERRAATDRLRTLLSIQSDGTVHGAGIPDGWVEQTCPDGSIELVDHWRNHMGCLGFGFGVGALVAFAGAAVGYAMVRDEGSAGTGASVVVAVGLLIIGVSLATAVGHEKIVLRQNSLQTRKKFGLWTWTKDVRDARLHVEHSVDSDGDEHVTLKAISPTGEIKVFASINDSPPVVRLARRVAEITGWRLLLDHEVRSEGS